MKKKRVVGFVGWRGLVGSVLMNRMKEEGDFNFNFDSLYFTTSSPNQNGPDGELLKYACNVDELKKCDIIVACQGSDWTLRMYPELKKNNWNGVFLDASSALRMQNDCIIVLDPLNKKSIMEGYHQGIRTFAGGNCTVSLMLLALHGLLNHNLVEWVHSSTYQAASGAGSKHMKELIQQMAFLSSDQDYLCADALEVDKMISEKLKSPHFPCDNFGAPLATNVIPWIDVLVDGGQTKEEWKGDAEANKILVNQPIIVDGLCVRVGAMRCHSQSLLVKLREDLDLPNVMNLINNANEWTKVVPNDQRNTLQFLTPVAVSGKLDIFVGRIHESLFGDEYFNMFTVGDQLLWGAAEPLRRALLILLKEL